MANTKISEMDQVTNLSGTDVFPLVQAGVNKKALVSLIVDGVMYNVADDTTPQLGGDLDVNGKNIDYGAILTTNGTFKGEIMTVTVDTNAVGFGAVLSNAADFHFDEADADAIATCYMLVMAVETGTGSKKVLLRGQICNTSWNWAAGPVMLSTTQGTLTQTPVSGADDVDLIVGWALSADTIFFNPYAGWAVYKT